VVQKLWRVEVHNCTGCPHSFIYIEAKFWLLDKRIKIDVSRYETCQKSIGVHLFGPQRNEGIFEGLKVEPFDQKLRRYRSSGLRHVTRMNSNWVQKQMLCSRPYGRRRLGRPLESLLDGARTGISGPNPWQL
jgi:hypothetical protein